MQTGVFIVLNPQIRTMCHRDINNRRNFIMNFISGVVFIKEVVVISLMGWGLLNVIAIALMCNDGWWSKITYKRKP